MTKTDETLGYFSHHPDQSTDFCCEVDLIEGLAYEAANGISSQWPFWGHLSRALSWARREPMADDYMVRAKDHLERIEPRYQAGEFCAASYRP